MNAWIYYAILCAVATSVTALLVSPVRKFAIYFGVVDEPGPRRVNVVPVPRLGGLAMFGGMLAALVLDLICEIIGIFDGPFFDGPFFNMRLVGAIAGLTLMVLVGVIDDFFAIPAWAKLVGQIAAACVIVFSGTLIGFIKTPFGNGIIDLGNWAYPITILYLIVFANIINLIDGLDGLAAGVTGISALTLFILTVSLSRADAAPLAIILLGVCIGFLFFNFHPASIFMGDSGSLLLGMALGTVSLFGATRFTSVTALAVPIVIAGVPVIDTLSAIIRRTRGHQSIAEADSEHIHHQLLNHGFSQAKSVLIIYGWTAVLSAAACFAWNMDGIIKYAVLIVVILASTFIIWRLELFGPVLQHHFFSRRKYGSGPWKNWENQHHDSPE